MVSQPRMLRDCRCTESHPSTFVLPPVCFLPKAPVLARHSHSHARCPAASSQHCATSTVPISPACVSQPTSASLQVTARATGLLSHATFLRPQNTTRPASISTYAHGYEQLTHTPFHLIAVPDLHTDTIVIATKPTYVNTPIQNVPSTAIELATLPSPKPP
jgi:hypothetical protein